MSWKKALTLMSTTFLIAAAHADNFVGHYSVAPSSKMAPVLDENQQPVTLLTVEKEGGVYTLDVSADLGPVGRQPADRTLDGLLLAQVLSNCHGCSAEELEARDVSIVPGKAIGIGNDRVYLFRVPKGRTVDVGGHKPHRFGGDYALVVAPYLYLELNKVGK